MREDKDWSSAAEYSKLKKNFLKKWPGLEEERHYGQHTCELKGEGWKAADLKWWQDSCDTSLELEVGPLSFLCFFNVLVSQHDSCRLSWGQSYSIEMD